MSGLPTSKTDSFGLTRLPSRRNLTKMADADEDVILRAGTSKEETDLTEETQDFRFLSAISYVRHQDYSSSAERDLDVKMLPYQSAVRRTSSLMLQLCNRTPSQHHDMQCTARCLSNVCINPKDTIERHTTRRLIWRTPVLLKDLFSLGWAR